MKKFTIVFVILLGLSLAAVLTWGVLKAVRDLSIVIATGTANHPSFA